MLLRRNWFVAALAVMTLTASLLNAKPKYIFYMIGDGMGTSERVVTEKYKQYLTRDNRARLIMNSFPVKGMTGTLASNTPVTDSAAAGASLACGEKTAYGVVGMSADKTKKLRAITYDAKDKGMKVGIVSSVELDHATPACFYASAPNRGQRYEISLQLAPTNFDYFAGAPLAGARKSGKQGSPMELIKAAGYKLVGNKNELMKLNAKSGKILAQLPMGYKIDANKDDLRLSDLVSKGIEVLDNDKGFLMVVESGRIDWSGHANDIATNINEVLDFDDAIAEAVKFYKKHPKETLIVVTGDHETGGLKTSFTGKFNPEIFVNTVKNQKMSASRYTGRVRRWRKDGVTHESAFKELTETFGLKKLTKSEKKKLDEAIDYVLANDQNDTRSEAYQKMYGKKNVAVNTALSIVAERCGVTWTTFGHSGVNVQTTALGNGATLFKGLTDNTDIAKRLRSLILK